ncbi:RNA-directed DNA polymerase [Hazenella sp. IB182357]|uniref:RNA-directed DNA polymerase n=1 Tax=Polycladospora coralii TaxID=2771432 RepID=A0A926NGG8_9BACL|nr:reverse transcriptase family protein [Polycladospora coralii]MBD1373149.1 RNA-directed DNA polymerase [Polycladospora coralii]
MSEDSKSLTRAEWYERIKQEGKYEAIRSDMLRLGFYQEPEVSPQKKEQWKQEDEAYQQLLQELQQVQLEAGKLPKINDLLAEARQKRIAASRQKRVERKAVRLKEKEKQQAHWQQYKADHIIHLGRGVSAGLQQQETDETRLNKLGLPVLTSSKQIATQIGLSLSELKWLTYHRNTATISHYHHFTIPKKNGEKRVISSPKPLLRIAQSWIKEAILDHIDVSPHALGFLPQKNIMDNARPHVKKDLIAKMDLKDFFPTITFWRVRGLFQSFGYSEAISTLLALVCTEPPRKKVSFAGKVYHVALGERQLPQGACTSPALTNIICRRLDSRMNGLADSLNMTYTRYADDLTFSGTKVKNHHIRTLLSKSRSIITFEGFHINEEKTRILRATQRQKVTGIVVNKKLNISRQELRSFRALLHNVKRSGLVEENRDQHPYFWGYIIGYAGYIRMVRPDLTQRIASELIEIAQKYQQEIPAWVHQTSKSE